MRGGSRPSARACDEIVQDFETCLRTEEPMVEMAALGVRLVGVSTVFAGSECN